MLQPLQLKDVSARYPREIAELRDFLAKSGAALGTPETLRSIADRLRHDRGFHRDLTSYVWILEQGGAAQMSYPDLLAVLALAASGMRLAAAADENDAHDLLRFLMEARRSLEHPAEPQTEAPAEPAPVVRMAKATTEALQRAAARPVEAQPVAARALETTREATAEATGPLETARPAAAGPVVGAFAGGSRGDDEPRPLRLESLRSEFRSLEMDEEDRSRNRRRTPWAIAAVLVLLAVAAGVAWYSRRSADYGRPTTAAAPAPAAAADDVGSVVVQEASPAAPEVEPSVAPAVRSPAAGKSARAGAAAPRAGAAAAGSAQHPEPQPLSASAQPAPSKTAASTSTENSSAGTGSATHTATPSPAHAGAAPATAAGARPGLALPHGAMLGTLAPNKPPVPAATLSKRLDSPVVSTDDRTTSGVNSGPAPRLLRRRAPGDQTGLVAENQPPEGIAPYGGNPAGNAAGNTAASGTTAGRLAGVVRSTSLGIMAANVVYSPVPVYPAAAAAAHVQGEVKVQADVDRDGNVASARVISGPSLLRDAALDAVQHWRFKPYTSGGKPIPATAVTVLDFELQ